MEFAVFKAPLHHPIERERERERKERDTADLVTFTEEILNGKLHFLSSDS